MPDPTPKPTAEERVIELTRALKVIDEMRRQNLARVDDATRKAFEEAAERLDLESKRFARGSVRRLAYKRAAILVRALAKEQSG